jgi:predicted metal-dependent hydrolase
MGAATEYDPRYLAGILFFNRREFFEAHEVWEDLWHECGPENRRFYQSLIQAAVALHHWGNRNWRGARRLFHSSRNYMSVYPARHLGVDRERFWREMERAFAEVLPDSVPDPSKRLDKTLCPTIVLNPPPA